MGYYRSRFALGWIANATLTLLFFFVLDKVLPSGAVSIAAGDVEVAVPRSLAVLLASAAAMFVLNQLLIHGRENVEGAIFITGCDSGMGLVTALHLAKLGFHVYAGCFLPDSDKMIKERAKELDISQNLEMVSLDVTKTESIQAAAKFVENSIASKGITPGLVGVINCAGIAITGPCEYLPVSMYRQLFDVNYFGYVEVTQTFLPLLKASQSVPGARRSRVICVGTGGGVMTPAPALLSAYMGSKWAVEAYVQCFRMEMLLQKLRIDGAMISPGFIKPTNIVEAGKAFIEKMWRLAPPNAREEYEEWVCRFQNYNAAQTGDSPQFIAEAMEEAMLAGRPELGYKVGFESQASPYAGSLPTFIREKLVSFAMFNDEFSTETFGKKKK
eukprot:m.447932 g.447932  ORF g.447932 m.447932 type:complete len:386 (+) comp19581_c0_seq1:59-1216(+)